MAVEIRILSGARRGECIYLDGSHFRVGSDPDCEVFFDPQADPPARNRSALLNLTGEGWLLRPTGTEGMLVNQEPAVGEIHLRSGDLVRLSDSGPDFLFAITPHGTPTAKKPLPPVSPPATVPTASSITAAEQTSRRDVSSRLMTAGEGGVRKWRMRAVKGLAVVLALALVTGLAWLVRQGSRETAPTPLKIRIEGLSSPRVDEGTVLSFRMTVRPSRPNGRLTFSFLGQPPAGARLDPHTGEFAWTPDESQGPAKFPVTIRVSGPGNAESTAETTFWIEVRETNTPPRIVPPGEQTLDAGKEAVFNLTAHDADQPVNRTTFRIVEGPEWIRIDPSSGVVRCSPPAGADGPFEATFAVNDDGQPPLEGRQTIKLMVRGDAWGAVADRLRQSTYLVEVEFAAPHGTASWPFATAVAIDEHTLLSSAREIHQMAQWLRQGQRLWVNNPALSKKETVDELRVRREFVAAMDSPGDWIYANVGLLRTTGTLPMTIDLPSPSDLEELEEGFPVVCFGYTHDGGKITRFDHFEPGRFPGEIYLITRLPEFPNGSRLLEVKGEIPQNVVGSPVVNCRGTLLGIYGLAAGAGAGVSNLHYVTAVDREVLETWQKDAEAWVSPPAAAVVSESSSNSSGPP